MGEHSDGKWLLLIHQIPIKPAYFRVKIWRRLQGLGAMAIKNSVYVIPRNEETLEDFQWVLREIIQGGGEASICAANFIEGLTDDQVETMFQSARDADYAQIAEEAKFLVDTTPESTIALTDEGKSALEANYNRLSKKLASVSAIDFFGTPGREPAEALLATLETRVREARKGNEADRSGPEKPNPADLRGRTWVTRKGVFVDRIACAWLIRRFIDPEAKFKFVAGTENRPKSGELRFDMFEGEFTHEGDLCSFEVFIARFFPHDEALVEIGKIIHDLDFKDSKFGKPETAGIGGLLNGLASAHKSDETRLERGVAIFEDLYEYFRRK